MLLLLLFPILSIALAYGLITYKTGGKKIVGVVVFIGIVVLLVGLGSCLLMGF